MSHPGSSAPSTVAQATDRGVPMLGYVCAILSMSFVVGFYLADEINTSNQPYIIAIMFFTVLCMIVQLGINQIRDDIFELKQQLAAPTPKSDATP